MPNVPSYLHLDLKCMDYDQKKVGSQIENLIPNHKSP
jgi:hypothetical protein